ncbi:uncharacterized protein LOC121987693 [Zingiber officinale]|uniref:Uncharacterized protein n=1 Tax=Zingiber officinale TaxID=94328 RepID=A0A8J5L8R5_ZINOF|nr:uncharacterized protein LOC121987693 [Zingiber officinale]KAG6504341.1 hypothetical protein ZIOFF_036673 [Zingiber officinale]
MAQQEGGWPLGLQPLNLRIDLVRNVDFSRSNSLSTLITTSSYSSSSELDSTESAGSLFRDRSITLGSLIGITGLLDLSSRSLRRRRPENSSRIKKKINCGDHKAAKHWFSSLLCAKLAQLGGEVASSAPSLGHLLEAERRAGDAHQTSRRTGIAIAYELEGLAPGRHFGSEPKSLSSDGRILPPSSNSFALLFPCMSDQVAE